MYSYVVSAPREKCQEGKHCIHVISTYPLPEDWGETMEGVEHLSSFANWHEVKLAGFRFTILHSASPTKKETEEPYFEDSPTCFIFPNRSISKGCTSKVGVLLLNHA